MLEAKLRKNFFRRVDNARRLFLFGFLRLPKLHFIVAERPVDVPFVELPDPEALRRLSR